MADKQNWKGRHMLLLLEVGIDNSFRGFIRTHVNSNGPELL